VNLETNATAVCGNVLHHLRVIHHGETKIGGKKMVAVQPKEQKSVLFYDDEITAMHLEDGRVFIPMRPLIERLGIDWNGRRRINRDAELKDEVTSVDVTSTQGDVEQRRAMLCLPLDYISGFLFGINADRVNPDVRDQLIRYQRECYKVLADAFQHGRLITDTDSDVEVLTQKNYTAGRAYQIANNHGG